MIEVVDKNSKLEKKIQIYEEALDRIKNKDNTSKGLYVINFTSVGCSEIAEIALSKASRIL